MTTMNISLPDEMRAFVEEQLKSGGYSTASEYIRDLIRRDLKGQREAWQWLKEKLEPGLLADDSEFIEVSAEEIIARAKKRHLNGSR